MPLRTKQQLRELPPRLLTLTEYCWLFPEKTCVDHYNIIRDALEQGLDVEKKALTEYPSLKTVRRKRGKRHESSAGDGQKVHG